MSFGSLFFAVHITTDDFDDADTKPKGITRYPVAAFRRTVVRVDLSQPDSNDHNRLI